MVSEAVVGVVVSEAVVGVVVSEAVVGVVVDAQRKHFVLALCVVMC